LFVSSEAFCSVVCSEARPGLEPVSAMGPGASGRWKRGSCEGWQRRGALGASLLPAVEMLLVVCAAVLLACVVREHVCLGNPVLV